MRYPRSWIYFIWALCWWTGGYIFDFVVYYQAWPMWLLGIGAVLCVVGVRRPDSWLRPLERRRMRKMREQDEIRMLEARKAKARRKRKSGKAKRRRR
ncbi:hypothetical protein [Nocardia sp. NPDC020380]|uniref:hypothetical protein n=1 Tax=Nocardia sp. NPDC020380 TaxID=3364309 RepID=UPI00378FDFB2